MAEYIEREALMEEIDEMISNIAFTSPYEDEIHIMTDGMERVKDCVYDAPAADVVEVKHGRWESNSVLVGCMKWEHYYACTACGRRGTSRKTNYCPNCGARMDGDTDG